MLAQQIRRKFSVKEYIALFQFAVETSTKAKTELVDGEIVELSPLGFRHAKTQQLLARFLVKHFSEANVFQTGSIIVDDNNMLEPDLFVLQPDALVEHNYPAASQLALVVEVADSTIRTDLLNNGTGKLASYAKAQTPAVWVVDVAGAAVFEFSAPNRATYQECKVHRGNSELLGQALDIASIIAL